jgi:hypothetical protein
MRRASGGRPGQSRRLQSHRAYYAHLYRREGP